MKLASHWLDPCPCAQALPQGVVGRSLVLGAQRRQICLPPVHSCCCWQVLLLLVLALVLLAVLAHQRARPGGPQACWLLAARQELLLLLGRAVRGPCCLPTTASAT